jgi:hypothetical protein
MLASFQQASAMNNSTNTRRGVEPAQVVLTAKEISGPAALGLDCSCEMVKIVKKLQK